MSTMAVLHSGASGRSTLNPNAPLFIPLAYQQVEDFSPEWWELVKTTPWFRDHWFHQHQEQESFDYDDEEDAAYLLPDSFDLGIIDEFSMDKFEFNEATLNESTLPPFVGAEEPIRDAFNGEKLKNGFGGDMEVLIRSLSLKSPKNGGRSAFEPAKHREKPVQFVSGKYGPRRNIQQPR